MNIKKIIFILIAICSIQSNVWAQKDTTPTIHITSAYKPVLRNAVKINLDASQIKPEIGTPNLVYNIPSQHLNYAYVPTSLRPLSLAKDSSADMGNRNFVKAGFGNLNTPYLRAVLGLGDRKTNFLANIYGDYIGSKGKIEHQDYSNLNLKAHVSYFLPTHEVYGIANLKKDNYYLYGYDHNLYSFSKSSIAQKLQDISFQFGVQNTATNAIKLNYNPNAEVHLFSNGSLATESNIIARLPFDVEIFDQFKLKGNPFADISNYNPKYGSNTQKLTNNIVGLPVGLQLNVEQVQLNAGVAPTWNNGEFSLLPNVTAEASVPGQTFTVQAGWIGRFINNNYRNQTNLNPYLVPINEIKNTKETEFFGGIKTSLGKQFSLAAKVGWLQYENFALFMNDTTVGKYQEFKTVYEPKASNLRIHGDLGYTMSEQFSLNAGLTLNGYTGFNHNDKAWNTVPLEANASLRFYPIKQLLLKSDWYLFQGGKYMTASKTIKTLKGASDLSFGAEYQINKQFSIWADANNILNSKYQKLSGYEVYGANFLGGIIVRF